MTPPVRIIGVGTVDRGDDAIGRLAVRALGDRLEGVASVEECAGDVVSLVSEWECHSQVILVDAVSSGAPPGTIHRVDVARTHPLSPSARVTSGHGLGVAEAVALASALGCLPGALVVLGIEGACFDPGTPLSRAVHDAMPELLQRIEAEAIAMSAHAPAPVPR